MGAPSRGRPSMMIPVRVPGGGPSGPSGAFSSGREEVQKSQFENHPNSPTPQPQFTPSQQAASPSTSPQRLPPGARPPYTALAHQNQSIPNREQPIQTKMPLSTTSSVMVHSGFWQILAATGSRFLGVAPAFPNDLDGLPMGGVSEGLEMFDSKDKNAAGPPSPSPLSQGMQGRRGVTAPTMMGVEGRPSRKRVSIDMVGKPGNFAHLVHASDAEQAGDILRRWHVDGVGKLGHPAWVQPIKEASRARARARGVAEVQSHRDDVEEPGSLKVVNGLPSVVSSVGASTGEAVENDEGLGPTSSGSGQPLAPLPEGHRHPQYAAVDDLEPLEPPRFPQMEGTNTAETIVLRDGNVAATLDGTTRITPRGRSRPAIDGMPNNGNLLPSFDHQDPFNLDPSSIPAENKPPRAFIPSLTTIEKAASCKIFFETHYHAILKRPRDRDQRKDMLEKELARLNISDAEKRNVRKAWVLSETEHLREVRNRVDVGSFVKLKTIGHGAFGVVSLVKERGTGELYAMKQLRKADMLKKGQEGHVRAERDLLAAASSKTRWIVPLAYSFQDFDHLYLIMNFMSGGDLLTLLIDKDVFDEKFARFYFAEMVLAVEETHKVLGAIHRDIKPDNFLFDSKGHIAISDFGLATDFHWAHDGLYYEMQRRELLHRHGIDLEDGGYAPATRRFDHDFPPVGTFDDTPGSVLTMRDRQRRKLAYSVVGTNNYMSVDVLRGLGYDHACDWWSLGVILFEMLFGYPPFVSKSRLQTRQKIMNWRTSLKFPSKPRISREAQDLLTSLICEKEDRLGSRGLVSLSRPNSILMGQRSQGAAGWGANASAGGGGGKMQDGADEIKAHPWFRGIDWENLHLQTPPFVPQLDNAADTKYFEDDIEHNPLPPADAIPGQPPVDTTRDPMLRDQVQGAHLLDVRKQLAFQGWTWRSPRKKVYDPRRGVFKWTGTRAGGAPNPSVLEEEEERGRSTVRSVGGSSLFGRSLSV
ncbi:kinase-like protein [Meredithblackwellia eburnea MCA 4105]